MVARRSAVLSCPLLGCVLDTGRRRDWGNACWVASALVLSVAIFSACSRKEFREEKYPNGAPKSRGHVKQDAEKNYGRHGPWVFLYENGQKEQESIFKDDELEGPSTTWYANGQTEQESTYKAGKLEGHFIAWYENGHKKQESNYRDGKRDGLYATWYENGQKETEFTFKADKLEGHEIMWYANGQKKAEGTYKDGKEGPYAEWHENGRRAKAGTLTESESPAEPAAIVTDNNDILSFGKPTVKPARYGITRVLVEAKNVTQHQVTCTLTATFLKGDSIIGTADGMLSDVSAGDTKTAEFTTSDDVAGYDTLKLKTSSCF